MFRWLSRRALARVDAERVSLAGPLEEGERAIEHLASWAVCAWPMPPIGGPLDPRREAMFIPADLLDEYLEGLRVSTFGIRHLLVLGLLTDRRLVIRPLDAGRPAPRGQRYTTYDQRSLGRRSVWLGAIEGVTLLGAAEGIVLPDGEEAGMHLRIVARAEQGPVLDGPPMPSFDLSQLEDVQELYGSEPGLLLTVAELAFFGLLDFLLGMEHAGIRMMEPSLAWRPPVQLEEWIADWKKDRNTPWLPLYERNR